MRLPRFAELERRRRPPFPSRANIAGTNNCIPGCDNRHRRQVPGPCASEMRFRRCSRAERKKGEKVTAEKRKAGRDERAREKGKRDIRRSKEHSGSCAANGGRRGAICGTLRMFHYREALTGSYRISNELPAMPGRERERERGRGADGEKPPRARLSVAEDS